MAILHKGLFGPMTGKVGNMVFYFRNNKLCCRKIGVIKVEPTILQLASRQAFKVTMSFSKAVKDFTDIGFAIEAKRVNKHAQNLAVSYNRRYAITGEYPNQKLDFEKVLLCQGELPTPHLPQARLIDEGVEFTWQEPPFLNSLYWSDQVLLMAYLPTDKRAICITHGPARNEGLAKLLLTEYDMKAGVETYIAFISVDRKRISNSVYVGHLIKNDEQII